VLIRGFVAEKKFGHEYTDATKKFLGGWHKIPTAVPGMNGHKYVLQNWWVKLKSKHRWSTFVLIRGFVAEKTWPQMHGCHE
jgi:hypothetical protein